MSSPDTERLELIVAEDGSIPAGQLAPLGLRPGVHLRDIEWLPAGDSGDIAGTLPDFPGIAWEDFERASELATRDLSSR